MVRNVLNILAMKWVKMAIPIMFLTSCIVLQGQEISYSFFYRVYFLDKGENEAKIYSPEDLLSPGAMDRRSKHGIMEIDYRDIPVSENYIDQVSSYGLKIHCWSKWMNTALFKSGSPVDINLLLELPFVSDLKIVKTTGKKSSYSDKLKIETVNSDLSPYDRPLTMANGYALHNSGYYGRNILIAILDEGFINADQISSLHVSS